MLARLERQQYQVVALSSNKMGSAACLPVMRSLALAVSLGALYSGGAWAQSDGAQQETRLEEITVTGTRITRSGFSTPTPVTMLDDERMERLGISNVGAALNQLPSFNPSTTLSTQGFGGSGATFADLRGLGAQRNLVLINGRRVVPTTVSGNVDLNLVPSMMVGRSEVVTGGASAAYGSDAVAGVTNIILKTDLVGFESEVSYGQAETEDNETFIMSFAAGTDFADGRGHVVVGYEYADSDGVGDQYERDWGRREVMRIPNIGTPGLPFNMLVENVHNANGTVGGYIRGVTDASGQTLSPSADPLSGLSFNPDGSATPWVAGDFAQGSPFQVGGSGDGRNVYLGGGTSLVSPLERFSLYAHADYEISPSLNAFLEGSYSGAEATNPAGQVRNEAIFISADNPFIPPAIHRQLVNAGLADFSGFTIGRNGDDLGTAVSVNERNTLRLTAGLDGVFGADWSWDAYYQYGRTNSETRVSNNRIGKTSTSDPEINNFAMAVDAVTGPNGAPMCRVVATALMAGAPLQEGDPGFGCTPLNLLGENNFSSQGKDYAFGASTSDQEVEQHVFAVNLSGDVAQLWAGPLTLATGGEYRRDSADGVADPISQLDGWFVGVGQNVDAQIDVTEAYLEGVMPLLSGEQTLDLNGAVRTTRYDIEGTNFPTDGSAPTQNESSLDATTWKVGLSYQPLDSLRLRATRSRDIRAPSINELFGARTRGFSTTTDHGRGETVPLQPVLGGGNANLDSEEADTWTAGIVLEPGGWLENLRVSLDYYDIQISNAIGTIGSQNIVDRCYLDNVAEMCELIIRQPMPGDGLGSIDYIENTLQNINELTTSGLDLEIDYFLPLGGLGDFNFRLLGNYVFDYITVDSGGETDRAGQTGWAVGSSPGVADLVLDGLITWSKGPLTTTLHGRFIDEGVNNVTHIGPDDPNFNRIVAEGLANPLYTSTTNDNKVPSRLYLDLNASYDLLEQPDGSYRLQLFGRIANLSDKDPPQVHTVNSSTNQRYFDVIGRAYKVGLRYRF